MRILHTLLGILLPFIFPVPALAASVSPEITNYTTNTLQIITTIAGLAAVFFLVKGGYQYITSSGNVEAILSAKQTIKSTLIGLVIVLAAGIIVSVFQGALDGTLTEAPNTAIELAPIATVPPASGLTQVLIDALIGVVRNIVESATKPLLDSILGFLASTPNVLTNAVIKNFWLVMLGITDSLFVLIVALLGLHVMSASTFGFEEIELKQLLPRLGLAFLGANVSLFLADYVIVTCNALTKAVIDATGGLNHAWLANAINLQALQDVDSMVLITPIFFLIFLIICIVLLLMYVSRLIIISVGAALSPFIFLLWALPKFSDFAEISIKSYVVAVFTIFVHVVIIQLASAFLALPETGQGTLLSIIMAIGLFATLLKTPSFFMGLLLQTSSNSVVKNAASEINNVLHNGWGSSKEEDPKQNKYSNPTNNPNCAECPYKKKHRTHIAA